jgi:3,4-dihydroxy 2-butanone 4-phosphate synthase / GTP cyclohydrolase II
VGVLCELMNDDGTMARRAELEEFARKHDIKIGTIADLIRYRLRNERSVERVSEQSVQTEYGDFRLYAYEDRVQKSVHLALVHGVLDGNTPPLVRVHVTDTLRDLLGVRGAPHAWTLRAALERIAHAGSGVVVILREQETAAELTEALRALGATDAKSEVVAATRAPTTRPAAHTTPAVGAGGQVLRTYGVGAQILKDLGVKRMRVLSAPKQMHGISAFGLEIDGYVGEGT